MKYLSIAVITVLLFIQTACNPSKNVTAAKPSMPTCKDELNTIPEVAASSRSHGKQPDEANSRPLEGMQIALTINRMVRSKIDPDANADDACFTENTRENFEKLVKALKENS